MNSQGTTIPSEPIDQIFLHIGTRKTGSTSIQANLMESRRALEERGMFLVRPRAKPFRSQYTSILAATPLWRNAIRTELKKLHAAGAHTLILTAEDFYYLPRQKALKLVKACRALARKVTVVLFVRRQDQYVDSCYSQYLGAGRWVGNIQDDFERFLAHLSAAMDYERNLKWWSATVGAENLKVTPFVKGDTTRAFFDILGASDLIESNQAVRNVRHPVDLLRACVRIGQEIAAIKGIEPHSFVDLNRYLNFRANVRAALAAALTKNGTDRSPYSLLPEAAYRVLAERYQAANQQIAAKYGGGDDFSTFAPDPAKPYKSLGFDQIAPENVGLVQSILTESIGAATKAPKLEDALTDG